MIYKILRSSCRHNLLARQDELNERFDSSLVRMQHVSFLSPLYETWHTYRFVNDALETIRNYNLNNPNGWKSIV